MQVFRPHSFCPASSSYFCDSRPHPPAHNLSTSTHNHHFTTSDCNRPRNILPVGEWNFPIFFLAQNPQTHKFLFSAPPHLLRLTRIRPGTQWQAWTWVLATREWLHHQQSMGQLNPVLLHRTLQACHHSGARHPRVSHSSSFSPNRPNIVRDCP